MGPLMGPNLPGDSALYDVSVRRLTDLHSGFLQTDFREAALAVGKCLYPCHGDTDRVHK